MAAAAGAGGGGGEIEEPPPSPRAFFASSWRIFCSSGGADGSDMLATFFSTFALSVPADDEPSSPGSSPLRLKRRASACAAARAAAAPRSSAV